MGLSCVWGKMTNCTLNIKTHNILNTWYGEIQNIIKKIIIEFTPNYLTWDRIYGHNILNI